MSNEELKLHISELKKQMEDSKLDKEDQNVIGHLMSEISSHSSVDQSPEEPHTLIDTLEEQAAKFDNGHPLLASVLRQIATTLSNIGI